jgi:hypothetical protein
MKDSIDSNNTNGQQTAEREVSLGRHRAQCTICKHPNCKEIENAWLDWCSPATIVHAYQISGDSLYRHCHAFGLFSKRRRNIIRAYERIAELSDTVKYSGSNVLTAFGALMKLVNDQKAAEQQKARVQQIPAKEAESSTADTSLPESGTETPGQEPGQGQDEEKEPQCPEPSTTTIQ